MRQYHDFIWRYLQTMILCGCGESDIKYWNGSLFLFQTNSQKTILRTRKVRSYCPYPTLASQLSIVLCRIVIYDDTSTIQYLQQNSIDFTCMWNGFLLFVWKGWTSILMPLSLHPHKISRFVNIFKSIHYISPYQVDLE